MVATWTLTGALVAALIVGALQAGCRTESEAPAVAPVTAAASLPAPPVSPTGTASPSGPTITAASSPATSIPTITAASPSPTSIPTVTTVPTLSAAAQILAPYTIAGMRERAPGQGSISLQYVIEEIDSYDRYFFTYPSDGLTISGVLNIPHGAGPFPVVILLHGWFERDQYWTGADTWQTADVLARNGYLAIAPDYRSWGSSDSGPSLFHMGLVADVLNLIDALPSLPQADPARLGLLGHSMGGGITTKVLTIDDRVAAAVLYAPNSAEDADLIARWGPGCLPGQSQAAGDECNPGEIVPADMPQELVEAYLDAAGDPAFLRLVSPIFYLDAVRAPVQIHSGSADGASLTETPPEWSQKLVTALQAAEKDVTFYTYPGEGHYFGMAAWSTMVERALAHFDAHLRP